MYDALIRIVLFGDETEAKKAFVNKHITNLFVADQTMTIGVDYAVKNLSVDGQKVKLQISVFGDRERYKFLLPTYVRGTEGGLFVYDVTNYSSFANIDDWLNVIRKELKAEENFPILAVGIVHAEEIEREVSTEKGIKIAKSRNLDGFIECNPKTGKNGEKAFEGIARLILANYKYQRRKNKEVKEVAKDEEYLITYTRHLEKKLRKLEAENLRLEEQVRLEKLEKQLRLKQDLSNLGNEIDKYKKMGI